MVFRKKIRARPIRRGIVPARTKKIRKMAGQAPESAAEKLTRYARYGAAGYAIAKLAYGLSIQQGLTNVETKYIDTNLSAVAIDNTGNQAYTLNDCAEGDDVSQRNGRFILDKGVQYRLRFLNDAATNNSAIGYAFVYVKDQAQLNLVTAGPQWTDVFNTVDPQALINKNVSDNYVIIKRGMLTTDLYGNDQRQLNGYINLKGLHTKYNAATTGAIQKGALVLLLVSDHAAASNPPHISGAMRFTFHDN